MKSKFLKINILISLLLLSIPAIAANSPPVYITEVKSWGNQDLVYVNVAYSDAGASINSTCNSMVWQVVASDADGKQRLFSMLLTAYVSNKKVSFWYESGDCGSDRNAQRTSVVRLIN